MGYKSAYGVIKSLKDTGEGQNSPCAGHIAGEVLHSASHGTGSMQRWVSTHFAPPLPFSLALSPALQQALRSS